MIHTINKPFFLLTVYLFRFSSLFLSLSLSTVLLLAHLYFSFLFPFSLLTFLLLSILSYFFPLYLFCQARIRSFIRFPLSFRLFILFLLLSLLLAHFFLFLFFLLTFSYFSSSCSLIFYVPFLPSLSHSLDKSTTVQNTTCQDQDLRLTNGSTVREGRVEVCYNQAWGTICDTVYGGIAAGILCKQLDFRRKLKGSCLVHKHAQ